jgi:tetratricopeptide (TPR) repeat protein
LGDGYFNLKKYEKAIENYELLLAIQKNIPAMLNTGRSYQLKKNPEPEKAFQYFKDVEKADPNNYINLLSLGDNYYNQKPQDVTNSYNYYLKAFELEPNSLPLVQALDELAFNPGNKNQDVGTLIRIYKKYVELEPSSIKPLISLGICYENTKPPDIKATFEAYKKAYDLKPESPVTNQYMGEIYLKTEEPDYDKALQHLAITIAKEPENKTALFHAGWANFAQGKYAEADSYFTQCLDSIYSNIANQNLGHIALINKHEDKAKEFYKTAYNLFADKNEFKETSLSDFSYLEKAGVDKNKFENLLQEVMNKN